MAWKKNVPAMDESAEEDRISKINAAGIINITIENLWKDCYSAMAQGDLVRWNRKLDAIWLILGGDVVESDENDKLFHKIDLEVHTTGNLRHKPEGFARLSSDIHSVIAKQYLLLRKKSLFLRRLQNQQGKGTSYINPDDSDFD